MDKKAWIIIIIVALIIIVAAVLLWKPPTQKVAQPTVLALENNAGDHWTHSVAVMENVTKADGTIINFYADIWIKPNDKVTIDLSKELGYNGSLPAGTTFTLKLWTDPHGNKTGNATLNMKIYAAAKEKLEEARANAYYLTASHVFYPLNATITSTQVKTTQNPTEGALYLQGIKSVYVELLITVNPDGTLTIKELKPPIFCELAAGG